MEVNLEDAPNTFAETLNVCCKTIVDYLRLKQNNTLRRKPWVVKVTIKNRKKILMHHREKNFDFATLASSFPPVLGATSKGGCYCPLETVRLLYSNVTSVRFSQF